MGRYLQVATTLTLLLTPVASFALEPGLYHGGGSRYIGIARVGDRICYQGSSNRGMTTATLIKVGNSFRVHGWNSDILLQANGKDMLNFGNSTYRRVQGELIDREAMQNCLRSPNNFSSMRLSN